MRCARCSYWVYRGFEIQYREKYYHQPCAAEEARNQTIVTRKKKSYLRVSNHWKNVDQTNNTTAIR